MKKIVLIIMMFISVSAFADKGDIDVSVNAGISTGTGFGLTYSITDNLRIKIASVLVILSGDSDNTFAYSIGGSVSFDLKKLGDNMSSVYLFAGTNHLNNQLDNVLHLYGAGLGLRKFVDEKLFFELELGYAMYDMGISDETDGEIIFSSVTGSLNLGYRF